MNHNPNVRVWSGNSHNLLSLHSIRKPVLIAFFDNETILFLDCEEPVNNNVSDIRIPYNAYVSASRIKLLKFLKCHHYSAWKYSMKPIEFTICLAYEWEIWEQPPYSLDLPPCEFHVFGPRGRKRINSDADGLNSGIYIP